MIDEGLSVLFCTDNRGVYKTDLTNEYALALEHGLMPPDRLVSQMAKPAQFAFCNDKDKAALSARMRSDNGDSAIASLITDLFMSMAR